MATKGLIPYHNNQLIQGIAVEWLDHLSVPITSVATRLRISEYRTGIVIQNPSDSGGTVFLGASDVTATAETATRGYELSAGQALSKALVGGVDIYAVAKAADILVVGSLDVDTVAWSTGTSVVYTFAATPDLSGVSAGMWLKVSGSKESVNDGIFLITAVNDGSDTITVTNAARTSATGDETASTGTGTVEDPIWIFIEESR